MDLAEEEHRLRDEWLTYAQAGFLLQPSWMTDSLWGWGVAEEAFRCVASVNIGIALRRPEGVSEALATDAQSWMARWTELLGRLAAARTPGQPEA